jgi:hypothetical protein
MRAAKDGVEWRRVSEEHDKCAARNDAHEVVLVANYAFPERETVPGLDGEDLGEAVSQRKITKIRNPRRTLKHCVKNIDRYAMHENVIWGELSQVDHTYQWTALAPMPRLAEKR